MCLSLPFDSTGSPFVVNEQPIRSSATPDLPDAALHVSIGDGV